MQNRSIRATHTYTMGHPFVLFLHDPSGTNLQTIARLRSCTSSTLQNMALLQIEPNTPKMELRSRVIKNQASL